MVLLSDLGYHTKVYIYTYFPILYTYIHIHPIHDAMEMDYGTYSHDHGYVDFGDDHHYAGPRYVQDNTHPMGWLLHECGGGGMTNHPYSSLDEHHMDGMRHDSVDYGDPNEPRRKRQKFHRSRTACFPVSHLLHYDTKEYQSDVSVVPDKEG